MYYRLFAAIVAIFFLAGCATNYGSQGIDDFGRYSLLEKNKTNKLSAHEIFGQPYDVNYYDTGDSSWTYYNVSMVTHGATFVPVIGLFAGGSNTNIRAAVLHFSAAGLYQKVETWQKGRYNNTWGMSGRLINARNEESDRVEAEMHRLGLPFDREFANKMYGTADIIGNR